MNKYPAFSKSLEQVKEYYKLEFNNEGFPIKKNGKEEIFNPIYGVYVIKDWRESYEKTKNIEFLIAAEKVAQLAIKKMQENKKYDAKYFIYKKGKYISRGYKDHISALTQSYYALEFIKLFEITTKEEYLKNSEKCFNSLLIPVKEGGVFFEWGKNNISIEEFPNIPNDFILNGWQTSLINIYEYFKLSRNEKAKILFEKSYNSLLEMIELFDAEEYFNSRYSLTGFIYGKIIKEKGIELEVKNIKIIIPQIANVKIEIKNKEKRNRYQNFLFLEDLVEKNSSYYLRNNSLRMNILFSRASYPQKNMLYLEMNSLEKQRIDFYLYKGKYNPMSTSQIDCKWTKTHTINLEKGINKIELEFEWKDIDLVSYPTNFLKTIDGKNYNVYHYIHIENFKKLYRITKNEKFEVIAEKFSSYIESWKNLKIYENLEHVRRTERIKEDKI